MLQKQARNGNKQQRAEKEESKNLNSEDKKRAYLDSFQANGVLFAMLAAHGHCPCIPQVVG